MSKLEISNGGTIRKRCATVRRNASDLSPIGEQLKKNALDFNRERAIRGVDIKGTSFSPLKESTLRTREGTGPPLAPDYAGSSIVTGCVVEVEYAPGYAIVKKSYPGFKSLKFHVTGTPHMAKRDPTGYSREEKQEFGNIIRRHVTKKG